MQQCGICLNVYDESEYSYCPYCEGLLSEEEEEEYEYEDEDEEETNETYDKELRIYRIISNYPGVYDDEGEYIRCPICGMGLRNVNGTITCPDCDT